MTERVNPVNKILNVRYEMGRKRRILKVHEHNLKLEGGRKLKCHGCREEIAELTHYWCSSCRHHFHETCAKLPLEIELFFHPCRLFLNIHGGFTCSSCFGHFCDVFTYRCEGCDFDMCAKCASQALSLGTCSGEGEGEQILHCCHPHPLQQLPPLEGSNSFGPCRVCDMPCLLGGGGGRTTWGCEPCSFHLHRSCLLFLPKTVDNKLRSTLTSWVLIKSPSKTCSHCNQTIHSDLVFYRSDGRCVDRLCISCCLLWSLISESFSSQVSTVINHFFHPCPDLKLILSPSSTCNACSQSHHHFSYHCKSCGFFLCFDCAQLPLLSSHEKEANQLVQHYCHWHPLKLFTGTQDTNHICNFCENLCTELFYSCIDQCQFYIHKSCMDLFLPTNSRLLSQTLALLTVPSFECTTCNRQLPGLTFYSSDRKCNFCVKCVLWPENELGNDGRFSSAPHWHQLILQESRLEDKRRTCFLCKEPCIAWTWSYKCSKCDFFFHKWCAELPAEFKHPIHQHDRLVLTKRSSTDPYPDMTCKLCLRDLSRKFPIFDWVYRCQQCDFQLDTQCATCLPSLRYKGHPHLLYVVINMHGDINCQSCGKSCKGSCTFRCPDLKCNFCLHLQCGPLPRTVKHACHVHPLMLKDYYVEDNDSDQFACHICEEEREPRLRVYCCSQGCLMISDVKCVLYEVLPLLRGERGGEVELITPFPQVACAVINNKSVFAKMKLDYTTGVARYKEEMIKKAFSHRKLLSSLKGQLIIEGEKDDEAREDIDVKSYPFTWRALSCFLKLLRIPPFNILDLPLVQQYKGSTMEGDYALPKILGPIYEEFFTTYNIIDHKHNLNFAEKRSLIFITCCFLHEMRITKVVDVKKDTILIWLGLIRFVQEKGRFNVGFVADNLKHVWQAHYYIQSKKIVDDKTLRLEQELEQVSMYRAELRTKMDEIWIKAEEAKARHQKLKIMDKEHDTYRVIGSRGPMKKVRSDALAIKWRNCYDSLVTYPGNAPAM